MEPTSEQEIKRHVKVYVTVFVALAFLTVVTVAISYLKLPLLQAILVALFIASIKGSLVAAFFMHLISEKQIIFSVLVLTAVFLIALLLLPTFTSGVPPEIHVS